MENNTVIEEGLIGLLLIKSTHFSYVQNLLDTADFFDKKNQIIFHTIKSINKRNGNYDIQLVINELKDNNLMSKIGGEEYIGYLSSVAIFSSRIDSYIKTIIDKAKERDIKKEIQTIYNQVSKKFDSEEIIKKIEEKILSKVRGSSVKEFIHSKEILDYCFELMEQNKEKSGGVVGIPSDFPSLDNLTHGFQKGDLIIVAARPSMGKTAFALNLAKNASSKNSVAIFSIEMPSFQIMNRILSAKSFVEGYKFKNAHLLKKDDYIKLNLAKKGIANSKLFIDDTPNLKINDVIWKSKRLHERHGLDILIIDYLQLITSTVKNFENRQMEVSIISRKLKQLARELNIPVIALSQLSRKVEQRESKIPMMSDIRESGSIEQDADLIMFLYREDYYKQKEEAQSQEVYSQVDIIISKHRNGATGKITLAFNPKISLFIDQNGNR